MVILHLTVVLCHICAVFYRNSINGDGCFLGCNVGPGLFVWIYMFSWYVVQGNLSIIICAFSFFPFVMKKDRKTCFNAEKSYFDQRISKYKYTFYSLTLKSGPSWGPFGPRQGP